MTDVVVHQALHGYRDGHRLLASSSSLSSDAARTLLRASDMSGPQMLRGFEAYLTGYPLGVGEFVLARTWYAEEMSRPGCVWTHSLLLPTSSLPALRNMDMRSWFRRPIGDKFETSYREPLVFRKSDLEPTAPLLNDMLLDGEFLRIAGTFFSTEGPVFLRIDEARDIESALLALWAVLWPAKRATFSFCSGSLVPRAVNESLLEVQGVPRSLPLSYLRRLPVPPILVEPTSSIVVSSSVARMLDGKIYNWVSRVATERTGRDALNWLVASYDACSRSAAHWPVGVWDFLVESQVDPALQENLVEAILGGAESDSDVKVLLGSLASAESDAVTKYIVSRIEDAASLLTKRAPALGFGLFWELLEASLTRLGEAILRGASLGLTYEDVPLDKRTPRVVTTLVRANVQMAVSEALWRGSQSFAQEVIWAVERSTPSADVLRMIIREACMADIRGVEDELVRIGGDQAVGTILSALEVRTESVRRWCRALKSRGPEVLIWLEQRMTPTAFAVATQILSPSSDAIRRPAIALWQRALALSVPQLPLRVYAFGVTLALLSKSNVELLVGGFQPLFDGLKENQLESDAWEWLQPLAPARWWREWDKCERLATAAGRLLASTEAEPGLAFAMARSPAAFKELLFALDRENRWYLKKLWGACAKQPTLGSEEQRRMLLAW